MKKLLSLILALTMGLGLTLPAHAAEEPVSDAAADASAGLTAAEETADAALARVTGLVKDALGLNTEGYDDFWGDRYENGLTDVWSLNWSGSDGDLSVEALDDGTVISYRLGQTYSAYSAFPTFPGGDADAAAQAARDFLDKVLGAGETVELGEPRNAASLSSDSIRFSGSILLNGLPSPLTYSITVRGEDNQVIRFSRDAAAGTFLGEVPGAEPSVDQETAAADLAATLALRLEYVLEEDGTSAVLRYVPEDTDTYYIDAVTGEALNMTELEALLGGMAGAAGDDTAAAAETAADSGNGLTEAEQAGIAQLEGVLSSAALDEALRSEAAYGLDGYALSSASYTLVEAREEGEEDQVLCALYYVASGEDYRSRTFTVDARTGAVQSIWSSAPWLEEGESPALTRAQAQARAEDYLSRLCGGRWDTLALAEEESLEESRRPYYTFTYVRQSDGIPFPENYYAVAIDAMDGSVYRLDYVYGEDVTFASPEDIVDEAAALAAWAGTYETTLAYRLVPRALDGGDETEARLMELGAGYWYGLRLTYGLEREDDCRGIDAATGEPVWQEAYDSAITYTDLEGAWAQADAEKLAAYGVGYDGGLFQHRKSLTQWDLVALMASLEGYRIDPENADQWERDSAYSTAYSMGLLARGERDDDAVVTRGELVRRLLDCAGYRAVARLEGIFVCTLSDADTIPASDLGYAALAQGLGMIQGAYGADQTATRGQLAAMLCRLLEREA